MRSTSFHRIKTIITKSGERIPVLVERKSGLPSWYPNLYSIKIIRNKNKSSNTMDANLRALMGFHDFLAVEDIDIESRLESGRVLSKYEVSMLVEYVRESRRIGIMKNNIIKIKGDKNKKKHSEDNDVSNETFNTRIGSIANYITWRCDLNIDRHIRNGRNEVARMLTNECEKTVEHTKSFRVSIKSYSTLSEREGLSDESKLKIKNIVDPGSSENPWKSDSVKYRNYLINKLLDSLGIRRGELLNIKISDIDFSKKTLLVARRADAIEDPRVNQPKSKTRDRVLPLSNEMVALIHKYIILYRKNIHGARRHEYLIVSHTTGGPLSLSQVNKIFREIGNVCRIIVSPHVLRHTWNDDFSRAIDNKNSKGKNINPEVEKKSRSYLMGWSDTSETASIYTRRFIREKSNKIFLMLQDKALKDNCDE